MTDPTTKPRLPHAGKMHWLDRAIISPDGKTITAFRKIHEHHPFLISGQFLPAALIELLAQAAGAGAIISPDGKTITAFRKIHEHHPFLISGQFLPAALIELLAQAAAAGAIIKAERSGKKLKGGVLAAVHEFKLFGPIYTNDLLTITGEEDRSFANFTSATFQAHVDQTLIAQARMTFHLTFE
jgi:predicted hotdog family 3-hydroxylacyl-ACP dehydratase